MPKGNYDRTLLETRDIFISECSLCKNPVERTNHWKKAVCLDCRSARQKERYFKNKLNKNNA